MSVSRCQQEVDSQEFAKWKVFRRRNPWSLERGDQQAAVIASTIANALCKKSSGGGFKISDFLLKYEEEEKTYTNPRHNPLFVKFMTLATLHNRAVKARNAERAAKQK